MTHQISAWRRLGWPVLLVYLLILAAQCSRAMFVIIVSWLALSMTGEFASVGRVLIWWPLLSLLIGPLLGLIIDRFNRRDLFVLGEGIRVAGVAWLALSIESGLMDPAGMRPLYLAACIVYAGTLISMPATQALLQAAGGKRTEGIVVGAVSVGLGAEIIGAIAGGLAIAALGIPASLMLCAALSVGAACVALPLRNQGRLQPGSDPALRLSAIAGGVSAIVRDRALLMICAALTLAWAAAQVTLMLLAAFVRLELGLDASAYGWIDAMWGVGGVVGSLILLWLMRNSPERSVLWFSLLLLSAAIAGFSMTRDLWTALLLHGLMGGAFAASLAVCDAHILRVVDAGAIGRVRSNLQAIVGATGIAIYLSPGFYADVSVRTVYLAFSAILAGAAIALLIGYHRLAPLKKPEEPSMDAL